MKAKRTVLQNVKLIISIVLIMLSLGGRAWCGSFDLKSSDIVDSVALFEKISKPGDPLYSYFSTGRPELTSEIVKVINQKVLPNPIFIYEATQLFEVKSASNSQSLSDEKKDEIMVKNRDFLTELYPKEILPREPEIFKQGFSLKMPIERAESEAWFKAEVMTFLNEIISNRRVINNWKNLKPFFDEKLSEKDIELFSQELQGFTHSKIPINAIRMTFNQKDSSVKIFIKGQNSRNEKELFEVSFVSKKHWRIRNVNNIKDDLLQTGYINKKEVQK